MGATLLWRPFFRIYIIMENNNENQRPSKMQGVVFPKAKYGVIAAIVIIIVVNLIFYKDTIFASF